MTTADTRIERALVYLRQNLSQKLLVNEIAQHSGISLKHFERLFKKCVGLPPKAYLRSLRVDKAKHLLIESEMKVTAVALEVGYSDLRHFERDFKKLVGLLPTEYRTNGRQAT